MTMKRKPRNTAKTGRQDRSDSKSRFFADVVATIKQAQLRAAQNVNKELVTLYWQAEYISRKLASSEWGRRCG
jgi:hypothetical protein